MPALVDPWFEAHFMVDVQERSYRYATSPILEGAQGLWLWCPCGYGKPEYPLDGARPHAIHVPFRNPVGAPVVPPTFGPVNKAGERPRWEVAGTSLSDLTISPSIAVGEPECWHGWIRAGQVTNA